MSGRYSNVILIWEQDLYPGDRNVMIVEKYNNCPGLPLAIMALNIIIFWCSLFQLLIEKINTISHWVSPKILGHFSNKIKDKNKDIGLRLKNKNALLFHNIIDT